MRPAYFIIALLLVVPSFCQTRLFSIGVTGGFPAQTPLQAADKMPFALGPTVDIGIFSRLSLETGVMFYRLGRQSNLGVFTYPENSITLLSGTTHGRALEIPVLGKFYMRGQRSNFRPFVTGGLAIRRTSLDADYGASILSGASTGTFVAGPPQSRTTIKWNADPSAGAGVDFKAGRFHLEPQVHYSYWGAGKNSLIRKNQVQFLLGFRF
ncbi:MAG: hypothetical protein C5B51_22090 [Terriglobia bacterium]|nr:MAG: hypothetical protein C5B51_22090 [Terriglobia bacterium]